MRYEQNEMMQNAKKVTKRIAITILCCVPILIVFGYLTRNVITNNVLQIVCFVAIMGVAVLIEELVVRKREARQKAKSLLEKDKDVFK